MSQIAPRARSHSQEHRTRPIVTLTLDPRIRAHLLRMASEQNVSFSYVLELVLTRQLDLPLAL